jgi:hypothetical protein
MKGARLMTNDEIAIPLVLGDEVPHFRLGGPNALEDRPPVATTSLATERFGLLAGLAAPVDGHRRMEEWLSPAILISNAEPQLRREAPGIE